MCAAEAQTDQAFHDQATQELCVLDYLRHADASEMEYAAFDDTYQAATGSIVSMDAAVQRARKIVDELEHEIAVVRSEHRPCTAPEAVGPIAHRKQGKRDMDANGEDPDAWAATHSAARQRTTVDAAGPQLDRLRTASEASLNSTETASPISDRDAIRGGLRAAAEGRILGDDGEDAASSQGHEPDSQPGDAPDEPLNNDQQQRTAGSPPAGTGTSYKPGDRVEVDRRKVQGAGGTGTVIA
eukprot:COSAG01_NODE_3832_length_5650_cov_80.957485_3_plen_241_part_00